MSNALFKCDEIIQWSEAKQRGQKWYFLGISCPRGHFARRTVSNRECRSCVDAKRAAGRAADPEKFRAKDREKYHRNPERERALMRANRAKHIEKRREYDNRRYRENPEYRAARMESARTWWKLNAINRGKANYQVQKRRAWVKQATPGWLTKEQKQQIRDFYIRAATMEGEWHVDHIYPLRAKNSCGLNVPWNLQILSGDENRKKRNLMPEERQV